MEVQPSSSPLFQLWDGSSLSIAVHSDVPQYERYCELIRANRGIVVEDASVADLCILSLAIPGADEISERLHSEGKLAIQDYWIRDSVDAERLLPWYPYQVGAPLSHSVGYGRCSFSISTAETEERDVHEFVTVSARYWPLFSAEELHRYVSRRCPHRSATSFKHLYETRQSEIDSRVTYLRGRLDNVLGFNNEFNRRPRMSFGSPYKHVPLSIQAPPTPGEFAASSSVALMPTPTATSDSRFVLDRRDARGTHGANTSQHEIPYEPPNIDNSPLPSTSPAPADASSRQTRGNTSSKSKGSAPPEASATALVTATEPVSISSSASVEITRPPNTTGIPVTPKDKRELARFLLEYPKGNVSFETHVETFRKISSYGKLRSAGSWKYVYRQYGEEVRRIMNHMAKAANSGTSNATISRINGRFAAVSSAKSAISLRRLRTPDRAFPSPKRSAPKPVQSPPRKITDEDKQALAQWMLDHPKDSRINLKEYFASFARQYDVNNLRSAGAWGSGASRHKEDIAKRQQQIRLERKGKSRAVHPQTQPPRSKSNAGTSQVSKRQDGNLGDADSELSSIESD